MKLVASLEKYQSVADGELVARAIAGREECFEELVGRYQRPIVAYAYRLVGDYDAALDLTQEVFIKIYSSLARYRPEYKFSTWIYKIAHNAAIDHLRRRAHARSATESFVGENEFPAGENFASVPAASLLTPEQESERAERRAEIETVVQTLPAAYRELIVLRHAHDLNYDEIAEITNLPLGTVKNRIFRAREMMRRQFLDRGITSA